MIAKTIAQQIGNQALAMIGAKNLTNTGNGLVFKIGRNSKSVNTIKIILVNTAIESLTGMYTRL